MLAMVLHPECQVKAQEELDRVLGGARLPEFEDRSSLLYVECVYHEIFRYVWWNMVIERELTDR